MSKKERTFSRVAFYFSRILNEHMINKQKLETKLIITSVILTALLELYGKIFIAEEQS